MDIGLGHSRHGQIEAEWEGLALQVMKSCYGSCIDSYELQFDVDVNRVHTSISIAFCACLETGQ